MKTTDPDALTGKQILVVEDEPMIALDLDMLLDMNGATVTQAFTLSDALKTIEKQRFDGAILDVNLGRGETCEPIAQRLGELDVPFILHSGDLDRHGELISSLKAPIVAKPARDSAVIDALSSVIG